VLYARPLDLPCFLRGSVAYKPARQDGKCDRDDAAPPGPVLETTPRTNPMSKIKIKTHRGAAKRFRKTASGKYKAGHANRSHILTKKATKRKRNLRQTNHVRAEDAGRLDRMLPYL
jgi:large subunit ribosomal protein L35